MPINRMLTTVNLTGSERGVTTNKDFPKVTYRTFKYKNSTLLYTVFLGSHFPESCRHCEPLQDIMC